jgi:TRAP-type C4-dicarboxylate transport system permease small subunit
VEPVRRDGSVDRVSAWLALAGGGLVLALASLVTASVLRRWLTSQAIPGDFELVQIGLAVAVFAFLPICQLHGANIIVDFFTQRLPERGQRWLDGLGAVLMTVMCALLSLRTAAGAIAVESAGEQTMIIGLPMWWAYAMLAPGLALAAAIALWQAGRLLSGQPAVPHGTHAASGAEVVS